MTDPLTMLAHFIIELVAYFIAVINALGNAVVFYIILNINKCLWYVFVIVEQINLENTTLSEQKNKNRDLIMVYKK